MLRRFAAVAWCVVLAGCPRPVAPGPDGGSVDAGLPCDGACTADERCDTERGTCVLDLPSKCLTDTAAWAPGTRAFVDASQAWGLLSPLAEGTRISSADLDGDGFQDLAIRRVGNVRDDPSGTRAVWLLRNTGSTFEDVTAESGILQNRTETTSPLGRPAEVMIFADVDNDGDVDVFTGASQSPVETSEILLNDGTGHFTLGPAGSDLRRVMDAIGGASFADVNLDGRIDLWVGGTSRPGSGTGTQDRLYLGDGSGAFFEVTDIAGLPTREWRDIADLNAGLAHTINWGTAACDLNDDGIPELLSSSYGRAPNHLWVADGITARQVHYVNRSVASGYAYDDNMDWTDNESARCYCKLHRTAPDCATVPEPRYIPCDSDDDAFRWSHDVDREPFRLGGNTGTTVCADVNGDGRLDLLNLEIVHWDVGANSDPTQLLINSGDPEVHFERPGNAAMGLTRPHDTITWDDGDITGAIFDFDNDGRPDVLINSTDYPGTRAWLYHQNDAGTFDLVPMEDGIDHQSAHGVAVADFDRDGDLDVVIGHSRTRCDLGTHCYPQAHARFFENVVGTHGNWLQLELEGAEGSNRAAIGARVTVSANGRTQTFEVNGGHGHYGIQHDLVVHAGLGPACEAEVTVRWPDEARTTQTFTLPANYRFHLVQGGRPQPVK
ncbi:MAG: CRTAC1 family protein [Myxococcaceae bacterium]|nr:CRTAC1 family protein [Myxococcaceae bacterium]